jgi:hypothetical protein
MLCFRLFSENNPAVPLADAVAQLREGQAPKDLYSVEPASFQQIPNAPFAYWVSERIRRLFVELPAFGVEGRTVRQGLATANDNRFLRVWLEVPGESSLNSNSKSLIDQSAYKSWCTDQSNQGMRWFPLAKGGVYSPFYQDLFLVGNWRHDGAEIKSYVLQQYPYLNGNTAYVVKNTQYYFEAGYTYPLRASRMCGQVLPAGSLISVRGSGIYGDTTGAFLALMNSTAFDGLVKMILGRSGHPQFDMGDINATPVPRISAEQSKRLGSKGKSCFSVKRQLDTSNLTSHAFFIPAMAPKSLRKKTFIA